MVSSNTVVTEEVYRVSDNGVFKEIHNALGVEGYGGNYTAYAERMGNGQRAHSVVVAHQDGSPVHIHNLPRFIAFNVYDLTRRTSRAFATLFASAADLLHYTATAVNEMNTAIVAKEDGVIDWEASFESQDFRQAVRMVYGLLTGMLWRLDKGLYSPKKDHAETEENEEEAE